MYRDPRGWDDGRSGEALWQVGTLRLQLAKVPGRSGRRPPSPVGEEAGDFEAKGCAVAPDEPNNSHYRVRAVGEMDWAGGVKGLSVTFAVEENSSIPF